MSLLPGTKLGPYVILGPLGAGGMGEVYRARDERLSRDVAVKVVAAAVRGDSDRLRRFELEARATGQLNHPNILAVHDIGTFEGAPYVVAELLTGETLRERMADGPIPPRKAIDYAGQVAQGLAAAHARGIVHRDLKPENLFITKDGRVKILDFGLAKLSGSEPEAGAAGATATETGTSPGVVMGTAGYMSPEQVRAQPVDHRSDIFSFGSVLYEMLAGRRAFQANSSVETMNAILREDPPEISTLKLDVPPALERIVRHCLEKGPDERYQSARDLAFQLEALSSSSTGTVVPPGALAPAARARRIGLLPGLAVGLIAVAAAFFAGHQLRSTPPNPTYSQLTYRQGTLFSARFTPDGETIVYGAAWDGHPPELFTARPGSPESRSLGLPPAEILSISPSGEMALLLNPRFTRGWQRTGTLARAPIAGGAPREILENVQDADWDPTGANLAVARIDAGKYRLEYPSGTLLYETDGWLSSPRVSRDGKQIAFLDHSVSGDDRGRVVVVDLLKNVKPLTDDFSSTAGLAWSPDGKEVWFTAGKTGNIRAVYAVDLKGKQRLVDGAPADLVVMDVAAGGDVLVARNTARRGIAAGSSGDAADRDLSWLDWSRPAALSLDGKRVLFDEQGQGGGSGYSVYLRELDGSPAVRLGTGSANALSPDGKFALIASLERRDRFILVPIGPGNPREIILPGFDINSARWRKDGSGFIVAARQQGQPRRVYVTDLDGGTPRPLTAGGVPLGIASSPDGRSVAVAFADDTPKIYSVDGGEPRPIPGTSNDDNVAGWSSDGRALYLVAATGPRARIDQAEIETGRRTVLHEISPPDPAGLIDLQYFLVSPDGNTYVYSYRRYLSTLYLAHDLH